MKDRKQRVRYKTKKVSNRATGSGSTSIATIAIIPKGRNEFTKFGVKPLNFSVFVFSISPSKLNMSKFWNLTYCLYYVFFRKCRFLQFSNEYLQDMCQAHNITVLEYLNVF